ncbi:MAG: DUF2281 domain-containing protein [Calothrix sp. FI2-JRJ7]|nr:DUF2281 domain-containing protein [Calothrix sp. FI2-JRJ7]
MERSGTQHHNSKPTLPPRVPGTAVGMIKMAPDFDEPLRDDILEAFEA